MYIYIYICICIKTYEYSYVYIYMYIYNIIPGTGTVSRPTPHTLENISKSRRVKVEGISDALSASIKSSITGNIKPLYPISLIPLLARLLTA
jgi:hypothetical protein